MILSTINTIINSPELSSGIIILTSYAVITLLFTALCTLTVNHATKRINRYRPITAQTITTTTRQARGNRQINNNRQRKVA